MSDTLLDQTLPAWDVVERHEIAVRCDAPRAWRAIHEADLAPLPVKALMALRRFPEMIRTRRFAARGGRVTLASLEAAGFTRLRERPGEEVVLGVRGRFWRPTGNLAASTPEDFRRPPDDGLAVAAWNFAVVDGDPVRVTTETRVLCGGAAARRSFRRYWALVGPFSGLIRLAMLRAIRLEAERSS